MQGCRRHGYLCVAGIMGRRAAGKPGNWGCTQETGHTGNVKRNLLQFLPQLLCLGENPGTGIARAMPHLSAQSSAEAQVGSEGNQHREATVRCWPGLGALQLPSLPITCHAVRPAGRAQGVALLTHFLGGNRAQKSLLIFKRLA